MEVIARAIGSRKLWRQVQSRRQKMVGHMLRYGGLIKITTESSIGGKKSKGRPR